MNLRRSKAARAAVSVTALALLIGPSAAGAWAQEESPAPEATTTEAETTSEAVPENPRPLLTNTFALGQSMQIRVNADLQPNANAVNFRWSVSHLTIQGPPDGSKDGTYEVPVPEGGHLARYLENFGKPPVADGVATWTMDVQDGFDTQRTVSLFPKDSTPKVAMTSKFTLDGQPISAQDLVGKSGVVTATYELINQSTAPYDVTVKNLAGEDVTTTVQADQPMVGIAKTLLPQRYTGLNTGSGIQGADGRGNNQVQWIALAFRPIQEDGIASFGWSANVRDAVIPSVLMQVAVVYTGAHPHEDDPATPEDESADSGSNPIPLDPAVAQIQAGLAQITEGFDRIAGSADPPSTCTLPDGTTSTDPLVCLSNTLNNVITAIISNTAGLQESLIEVTATLDSVIATLETADPATAYATVVNINTLLWGSDGADGSTADPRTKGVCQRLAEAGQPAETQVKCNEAAALTAEIVAGGQDALAGNLTTLIDALTDLNGTLKGILATLQGLAPDVDLGTVDEVAAAIRQDLLDRGGYLVVEGVDQLSGGVAQAKVIISDYLGVLSAEVQAAIADVQAGVVSADEAIVHLRSNLAGLSAAAKQSPLVYGPLPAGTPEGTVLAGAYEFRIDPADNNKPYTLPRILVGLLAIVGAIMVGKYVGGKAEA